MGCIAPRLYPSAAAVVIVVMASRAQMLEKNALLLPIVGYKASPALVVFVKA